MDSIALNFVSLLKQDNCVTVYRSRVPDSSQPKKDEDFRAKLPDHDGEDKWLLFDVSTIARDGYEAYEYEYPLNRVLTVHLIYQEFLETLKAHKGEPEYYIPETAIARKTVCFVIKKFDEDSTEVIIKPYYLKEKREFGLLFENKFSLKDDQPFNRQTQIRSFSLDESGKPNIYFYRDKKSTIEFFLKRKLSPLLSGSSLEINAGFSSLPAKSLDVKTYLVGDGKNAKSQFMGISANGPYRRMEDEVRYLFVFTERTRALARDIYLGLVGKLFPGQFPGLENMFPVPIHKDIVEYHLVSTFDAGAIQAIEDRVKQIKKSYPNSKVMFVAVLPKGFKGVEAAFDAYGYLKLAALRNHAYCQVVTEDTFFKKDRLKWSVSNIGLQIFSKLGGAPWLVQPAKSNCLIFGLGNAHEKVDGNTTKYTAYTVCLDSSGDFKYIKPLSSSKDEERYLDSLKVKLKEVLSSELGDHYKSLVLHLPTR